MTNRLVKQLPDAFRKHEDSNNNKLLQIDSDDFDLVNEDLENLRSALTFDGAWGNTLEIFGSLVDQPRDGMPDSLYRYLISAKFAQNVSGGDYESVVKAITMLLSCNQEDFMLSDFDVSLGDATKPCTVYLVKLPYQVLQQSGFSTRQAVAIIDSLLPVCITFEAHNFEGTFEFGGLGELVDSSAVLGEAVLGEMALGESGSKTYSLEYDESKGFSDLEHTIGGYFGMALGEDDTSGPLFSFATNRVGEMDELTGFADLDGVVGGHLGLISESARPY